MSAYNDNYRFLLVCIDCFSKYAWVRPLKNKTGPVVTRAFRNILDEGRVPKYLHTDHGTVFKRIVSKSYATVQHSLFHGKH